MTFLDLLVPRLVTFVRQTYLSKEDELIDGNFMKVSLSWKLIYLKVESTQKSLEKSQELSSSSKIYFEKIELSRKL